MEIVASLILVVMMTEEVKDSRFSMQEIRDAMEGCDDKSLVDMKE